ncbi:MAG: hypothetical protein HC827_15875 [Cyanobacteria bacterium RM1_2_2]|nr:hypothetical protein [Cyanobacteria bacterium RM1_2_2]
MAQHSIVKLAEQGEPRAIAFLLTRTLQKYGIMARANLKGNCLKLLLEGEQVPHQTTMVKLVSRGMQKLNVAAIQTVKLYGRKLDAPVPAWRQVIKLTPNSSFSAGSGVGSSNSDLPYRSSPGMAEVEPKTELLKVETLKTEALYSQHSKAETPESDTSIFQLDDLDPETMILLPVERPLQFEDLDPDALILYPLEPESSEILTPDLDLTDSSTLAAPTTDSTFPELDNEFPDADSAADNAADSTADSDADAPAPVRTLAKVPKLPKRLTFCLLVWLGLQIGMNTLILIYALLGAGSFALYAGLDLSNTNQPFASLLSVVVSIADFIVTPVDRFGIWGTLIAILLTLFWVHRLHATLKGLFEHYPISPKGAVWRLVLPIIHLWGVWTTFFTLAAHLATRDSLKRLSLDLRRLTGWFCLLLLSLIAWYGYRLWTLNTVTTATVTNPTADTVRSLGLYVAKDAIFWLLSLTWFRLIYAAWRGTRTAYREIMAPFLPPRSEPRLKRTKAGVINITAILLGGGASLLSLAAFNCLLGLIATIVFINNGLRPESILPTFFDSESLLMLALLGSFLCIGLGGFLTAHLAEKGLAHALGLGVFLTFIGLALQQSALFPVLTELPFWFQTASMVLIIPAALVGGGLRHWLKTL